MTENQDQMTIANNLLRQSQWKEAGSLFRQLWENSNDAYSASRYLYCLPDRGTSDLKSLCNKEYR